MVLAGAYSWIRVSSTAVCRHRPPQSRKAILSGEQLASRNSLAAMSAQLLRRSTCRLPGRLNRNYSIVTVDCFPISGDESWQTMLLPLPNPLARQMNPIRAPVIRNQKSSRKCVADGIQTGLGRGQRFASRFFGMSLNIPYRQIMHPDNSHLSKPK